jgi:hypothetical protein
VAEAASSTRCRRVRLLKARDAAARHPGTDRAADTLVELDGRILGKPAGPEDARGMLAQMSGRRHRVATGLVVLDAASSAARSQLVETFVSFRGMSEAEIEAYVATGEPLDKAGLEPKLALPHRPHRGDYYNVATPSGGRGLLQEGCASSAAHAGEKSDQSNADAQPQRYDVAVIGMAAG